MNWPICALLFDVHFRASVVKRIKRTLSLKIQKWKEQWIVDWLHIIHSDWFIELNWFDAVDKAAIQSLAECIETANFYGPIKLS